MSWVARAIAFLLLLTVVSPASALVKVGPGMDCNFTKIQDAINAVLADERNGLADPYIAVAGDLTYNEVLNIDGSNISGFDPVFGGAHFDQPFVQIYGDYDSDCQKEVDGSISTVSAANKSGSVMFIHGNRSVQVVLNHLTLSDAHNNVGTAL